jgi:uncharacterized repeat protein (TIGR01451 family)
MKNKFRIGRLSNILAAFLIVALGLLSPASALAHTPGITERVSVSSEGTEGNQQSERSAVSGDGRFVVFVSLADNLVPGDTNNEADIFVHDRLTGTTERVSVSSREEQANGDSSFLGFFQTPAISADGRFVAFASFATNLVARDTNNAEDIFVRDRLNGTTERASVTGNGGQANADSSFASISADGRIVAFGSFADNLVAGDTNFTSDVFVRDRQAGTTERVSVSSAGVEGSSASDRNAISADGRFVAFESASSNLVSGDTEDSAVDIYLRDRLTGTTEGVSLVPAGPSGIVLHSLSPAISADGRFVAFDSTETNLVPADTNSRRDIFVRDRQTGTLERVSLTDADGESNEDGFTPGISADGRFIVFGSLASNLVSGDTNQASDIFVRDRVAGTSVRDSVSTAGVEGDLFADSFTPSISADGQVVAFHSEATLAPGGTAFTDVYVHDERPATDLSVTKSDSPDPVQRNRNLSYTIVVTNNGSSADPASLTDLLPSGVRFVSATSTAGSCAQAGTTVTCELGTLSAGASATVTIVVKPMTVGTITNTAQVTGLQPDPDLNNNTDTETTTVTR